MRFMTILTVLLGAAMVSALLAPAKSDKKLPINMEPDHITIGEDVYFPGEVIYVTSDYHSVDWSPDGNYAIIVKLKSLPKTSDKPYEYEFNVWDMKTNKLSSVWHVASFTDDLSYDFDWIGKSGSVLLTYNPGEMKEEESETFYPYGPPIEPDDIEEDDESLYPPERLAQEENEADAVSAINKLSSNTKFVNIVLISCTTKTGKQLMTINEEDYSIKTSRYCNYAVLIIELYHDENNHVFDPYALEYYRMDKTGNRTLLNFGELSGTHILPDPENPNFIILRRIKWISEEEEELIEFFSFDLVSNRFKKIDEVDMYDTHDPRWDVHEYMVINKKTIECDFLGQINKRTSLWLSPYIDQDTESYDYENENNTSQEQIETPVSMLITADGDEAYPSPAGTGVFFSHQGNLLLKKLRKATLKELAEIREAKIAETKQITLNNAKHLAYGLTQYSTDYNDYYPVGDSVPASKLILPYLRNEDTLYNPADGNFAFVYLYSGMKLGDRDPQNAIIANLMGYGGYAQIYEDGHVEWIPDKPEPAKKNGVYQKNK